MGYFVPVVIIVMIIIILFKTARVVPQKSAFVVERLGKYSKTLEAGFHILVPFIDKVRYKLSLKEVAIDVPPQVCITKDNVSVEVDGILYLKVMDPVKAAYGIHNFRFATTQLAMTTMRSEIGKLELDKTFVERESVNANVVDAVDMASDPWGIKVTRYEIKNITPPESVQQAMEKQMRAEREKRAEIALSEGERQAKINRAEGSRQEMISMSEGEKMKRINEAEGHALEIERVAQATAMGIREIASAINEPGGEQAVSLRIAEQWIGEFGNLAKENNTMIIPADLADISGTVASLAKVMKNS
ncbi:MAG: paraslipin [Gemmatimonadaceae bacterium 4484_173]|nr:MAG: paraslipin [Gemmatimonadaceae bacterium 4484_173]RKZ02409.1 MAG: paraslipin [Candidatus Fermentibacteria bacterium]